MPVPSSADAQAQAGAPRSDVVPRGAAPVRLGLLVSPVMDADRAAELRDQLRDDLSRRYPDVEWELALERERLVVPPVHLTDLVEALRDRLLAEQWDLAVYVTELPLRLRRRPLLTHASPTHGVALVSLPAVGVVQRRHRMRDALADAVGALIGDPLHKREGRATLSRRLRAERRLRELAAEVDDDPRRQTVVFVARVIGGNVRLLLGMIAANHPWRLVGHLSRALLGALAAAVFALVTSDVWRIAAGLDVLRLAVVAVGSMTAAIVTLIVAHRLWERAQEPHAREQVALFNLATLATVAFGVASLYAGLFLASLAGAGLLIDSSLFASQVGHGVDFWTYVRLAWLASSLATAGGALGAMLETDTTVREAAYAYSPE
jgi:hypothetical protein